MEPLKQEEEGEFTLKILIELYCGLKSEPNALHGERRKITAEISLILHDDAPKTTNLK